MSTMPIREAIVGSRYLSQERAPITNRGPSAHTPGWYDVENETGRIVPVPSDYPVQPEEELPPEPGGSDPWEGEETGLGRVAIVKKWTRQQCTDMLAKIEAGALEVQATVVRELNRQLEALAKVEAQDPSTVEGRDELLRLRALESSTKRPGLTATIDALLGTVPIEGAAEMAASASAQRIVAEGGDESLPASFVASVRALGAELGRPLEQIDVYTVDALTRTVRSARTAAKACSDPALLAIAWRHTDAETIREVLARRHRALTGRDPAPRTATPAAAAAPPSSAPVERIDVRDLKLVSLPDGTADLWAVPAGGRARRLGKSTDPALASVLEHLRATSEPPKAAMPDLGALGPWLAAVKAAGFKVTITITSEDP